MSTFDLYDLYEQMALTGAQRLRDLGKAARKKYPYDIHAHFTPPKRNPATVINQQNHDRIPELIPLRQVRLSQSAFTFFRGTAGLMAGDLALDPNTGIQLVICGDAHINNFGFFASPERRLVFDLNDFDEAAPGPWEWDIKRLVTSVILCGNQAGFKKQQVLAAALETVYSYRKRLHTMLHQSPLERFYISIDEETILDFIHKDSHKEFSKIAQKAKQRTSQHAFEKMTTLDEFGRRRFIENPPILTHMSREVMEEVEQYLEEYKKTVRPDIALLLSQAVLTDIAQRVVGVGSVGTRCYVLAMTFADGARLILQIKEARPSVITQNCQPNPTTPHTMDDSKGQGYRVAAHQQILQAVSDPFLGYFNAKGKEFYVRQFRDMKGSIELESLSYDHYVQYVTSCGLLLARAHVQSPYAYWIDGYMGKSEDFDHAIVEWCQKYSKQVYQDYEVYVQSLGN